MSMCVSIAQARTKFCPRKRGRTKWLLWHVHVRFDSAGSHKMQSPEKGSGNFPLHFPYSYVCSFALSYVCSFVLSYVCSSVLSYVSSFVPSYVCSSVLSCVSFFVLSYLLNQWYCTRRWQKFQNRQPIREVGCCESWMTGGSHWCIEKWLERPAIYLSI